MAKSGRTLVILGGVAAAIAAAWALTRERTPSTPAPSPAPAPAPGQTVTSATPASLAYLTSPLHVRQGSTYRARLVAQNSVPPFGIGSTDADVGRALEQLGFQAVRVFSSPAELPASWPAQEVQAMSGTRWWFQGTWGLGTTDLSRPKEVAAMWQSRGV